MSQRQRRDGTFAVSLFDAVASNSGGGFAAGALHTARAAAGDDDVAFATRLAATAEERSRRARASYLVPDGDALPLMGASVTILLAPLLLAIPAAVLIASMLVASVRVVGPPRMPFADGIGTAHVVAFAFGGVTALLIPRPARLHLGLQLAFGALVFLTTRTWLGPPAAGLTVVIELATSVAASTIIITLSLRSRSGSDAARLRRVALHRLVAIWIGLVFAIAAVTVIAVLPSPHRLVLWVTSAIAANGGAVAVLRNAATLVGDGTKAPTLSPRLYLAIGAILATGSFYVGVLAAYTALSNLPVEGLGAAGCGAVALIIVAGFVFDINELAPHAFYRDRIADAFLLNPAITLGSLAGQRPVPLVTTAGQLCRADLAIRERDADVVIVTPDDIAGPRTPARPTPRNLLLASALAASAAAASARMGSWGSRFQAFLCSALNIRLGLYLGAQRPFWPLVVLRDAFSLPIPLGDLELSDGGHANDNLALFGPLCRKAELIVAVDATFDPSLGCSDLQATLHVVRTDLDVEISIDTRHERWRRNRGWHVGKITYKDGSLGWLLFVKMQQLDDAPPSVQRLALLDPAFPHISTADQFFTVEQFEALRQLGCAAGEQLLDDIDAAARSGAVPGWRGYREELTVENICAFCKSAFAS